MLFRAPGTQNANALRAVDIPYRVVYLVASCLAAGFVLGFGAGS